MLAILLVKVNLKMLMFSDVAFFDALFRVVTSFFIEGILALFFIFQGIKTKTKLLFILD